MEQWCSDIERAKPSGGWY